MVSKEQIIKKLRDIADPELNIDIWTLGLIYKIDIKKSDINIKMTFTFPSCPYGPWLLENVRSKISSIKGIKNVNVELTFDPPWEPSDKLKVMLGI
jgi:metal-sulfur cluster biosynthetic enzyme